MARRQNVPVLLDVATKVSICKAGITAKNVGSHLVFFSSEKSIINQNAPHI